MMSSGKEVHSAGIPKIKNGVGWSTSTIHDSELKAHGNEVGTSKVKPYGFEEIEQYKTLKEPTPLTDDERDADKSLRKLKTATIFVLCFFVVEVVGGVWAGSLAVITDAAHLLTDVSVSRNSCTLLCFYCDYTNATVNTVVCEILTGNSP